MAQPATNPKIEALRLRLKNDPKNRIFYPLAEELRKAGEFAEAEQVLRTGLVHHATYLSAWMSLGRVLRELKNDSAAIEALSKALQLDPGSVVAARLLGESYLSLGNKIEAIKKYKLVQALLPGDEEIDSIIEQLDRELIAPSEAAASPAPSAAAVEESPFAPEPEAAPFEAAPPAGLGHPVAPPEGETLFAPQPEVGEETKAMRSPKKAAESPAVSAPVEESPFAAEPQPAAEESSFAPEPQPAAAESPFAVPVEQAPAGTFVDEAAAAVLASEPAPVATVPSWPATEEQVYSDAAAALPGFETGRTTGAEPITTQHAPSPFEEPAAQNLSGFEDEAPGRMPLERAPLAAEVSPESYGKELPPVQAALESQFAIPAIDESDIFAPATDAASEPEREEPFAAGPPPHEEREDVTSTLTMADLYARQGLIDDARQIYETILQRDPQNSAVREKLEALRPSLAPASKEPDEKVGKLERWLSKVGRREVGSV